MCAGAQEKRNSVSGGYSGERQPLPPKVKNVHPHHLPLPIQPNLHLERIIVYAPVPSFLRRFQGQLPEPKVGQYRRPVAQVNFKGAVMLLAVVVADDGL